MKYLFLAFMLGCALSNNSFAQTSSSLNTVKEFDGVGGHFLYQLNEREKVNVNYSLTPKNPSNTAHFMIHTPSPMPFRANILDASGKKVFSWKPQQQVYLYNADWDISSLKKGNYTVQIFLGDEPKSIYEINFMKQ